MMAVLSGNSVAVKVREIYQNRLESKLVDNNLSVVVSHMGTFTLDFVSGLTDWMETLMVSSGDRKIVVKRMFTILIEGLKNVRKHGELDPKGEQLGFVMICKSEDEYQIAIANLVLSENKDNLIEFITKINAYSEEELHMKLQHALDAEFLDSESGAGLGMLVTRLKTGSQLHYSCNTVSDGLELFVFEVSLNR